MELLKKNKNNFSGKEKEQKELTAEQVRRRKMAVAIPIMLIPFCIAIYFIFFAGNESKENNAKGSKGINVEIPDPKVVEIVDDKRKAYQQEQLSEEQKRKMQSLDDYIAVLKTGRKTDTPDLPPAPQQTESPESRDAIKHSAQAYREATRQINSFYQEPKTENNTDRRELEQQVLQLKASLKEQEDSRAQRLDIMEKSYQMASQYLSPKEEPKPAEKEEYSIAVNKTKKETVSKLPQKNTNPVKNSSQPTNSGFITAVGGLQENNLQNTIRACVHDNQTITDGSRIKLRLLEEVKAGSLCIPKNSLIFGTIHLQSERIEIQIPTIEYDGTIIPVELTVYDTDGQKGIFIPGSMNLTAGKEAAGNLGQSLSSNVSIAQDVKQQLVMDATKILVEGGSQLLSKKFKEVKIHLKAGYQLLLAPKKLN